jgi:hypothetical protein|tara:strand:- start:217 stop:504 length:288 start_codon:yes stop_codon:yes gene_type:complete
MIEVALETHGGVVKIKIRDKEVLCSGSFDNFAQYYPLENLLSFSSNKDKEKLQADLDRHFDMMDSFEEEEEVYDYVISEFQKQGFKIIGEVRTDE